MQNYKSEVTEIDSVIVATFAGEISTHQYTEFRGDYNEICRLLSQSSDKRLLIDLTDTTFFGSLFIGIMMKLATQVRLKGGMMALCGLTPQLKQLMAKLLLLERQPNGGFHLESHATREDAWSFLNKHREGELAMSTSDR